MPRRKLTKVEARTAIETAFPRLSLGHQTEAHMLALRDANRERRANRGGR